VVPRTHAPGPLTLLHLGALGRSRGAMEMLDLLALCPIGTSLHLVGRFTDGSGPDFAARAAALGLAGRIRHSGWMPHAAALDAAAEADIGLVLFQPGVENHRLALPHKLFDCMMAGLPVIAPAFAEEVAAVVREAGCGLLVDSADPAAIAATVAQLADPALRAEMGARGRAAALGRFGWEGEAATLVGLYRRLAPLEGSKAGEGIPRTPSSFCELESVERAVPAGRCVHSLTNSDFFIKIKALIAFRLAPTDRRKMGSGEFLPRPSSHPPAPCPPAAP
jgi:hypothetical protein